MEEREKQRLQRFGFIPKKLEVEGRPELSLLPLNILFVNFFSQKGINMSASSLYEPDIETFMGGVMGVRMTYRNIYNPENVIILTRKRSGWEGKKIIDSKAVLIQEGKDDWNHFFGNFTANGLSEGEDCFYNTLPKEINKN